jgi:hypothetical protein
VPVSELREKAARTGVETIYWSEMISDQFVVPTEAERSACPERSRREA